MLCRPRYHPADTVGMLTPSLLYARDSPDSLDDIARGCAAHAPSSIELGAVRWRDLREQHDAGSCPGALQPDEMLIIEKMEKMVDPDQPEGEWITKYDLVEKVRTGAATTTRIQPQTLTNRPPSSAELPGRSCLA